MRDVWRRSGRLIGVVCDVLCCIKALSAVADELCLTCDVAMMEQNLRKNAATDVLPCEYSIHIHTMSSQFYGSDHLNTAANCNRCLASPFPINNIIIIIYRFLKRHKSL